MDIANWNTTLSILSSIMQYDSVASTFAARPCLINCWFWGLIPPLTSRSLLTAEFVKGLGESAHTDCSFSVCWISEPQIESSWRENVTKSESSSWCKSNPKSEYLQLPLSYPLNRYLAHQKTKTQETKKLIRPTTMELNTRERVIGWVWVKYDSNPSWIA